MRTSLLKPIILLLFVAIGNGTFSQKRNTGIGLTLSGGGAKGLAHIGILKAIDSAELNIDYLTGASMGSIVGGLYAAGYSGDSIEVVARQINWDVLLSNTINMTAYTMEEKGEYGKYAVELPVQNKKLGLPSGFLESQELWLTLEQLFFPVASINQFNKLSIPFRCIGTNLATGDAEAFEKGSLVTSIRASMAIPGAFSPVDIDGKRYVDGGVVRNFPVQDAIAMGAKYTIGVSVSTPLDNVKELDDAVKVLTQVVFLNENRDRIEESKLCDFVINMPMGDYTSASFADGDSIIDLGIAEGRKYYPVFKSLADSLKALYPDYQFIKNRLPATSSYKISKVQVYGLSNFGKKAFLDQIAFDTAKQVTYQKLQKDTRDAFAYRMYKSVVYDIVPNSNGTYDLHYKVKPESATMLKAGISENSFSGFGIHLNLTSRNFLTPFSRSLVSLNIGQNFRGLFEHLQMLGYNRPWSNRFQLYTEFQDMPTFDNFRQTGNYKLKYVTIDNRIQLSAKRKSAGGIGAQWEYINAIPKIESGLYLKGNNNYFSFYSFWQYNTLEKPQYPKKGTIAEVKAAYVVGVNPNFQIYRDGQLVGDVEQAKINYGNYARVTGYLQNTSALSKKWAWVNKLQTGINFGANQSLLNAFVAGGMNPTTRNQIMFAGLREGEIVSESMAALQTGPRFKPFGSVYVTLLGSVMAYDFISKDQTPATTKWVTGTGLTLGYDLPFGPVEFTLMYCGKTEGIRTYFNLGFPFKN